MATANRDEAGRVGIHETPILVDGQRLDQPTFHELYLQTPKHFRAELIEGVVHVMASPVSTRHARPDINFGWFLKTYSIETPGTYVVGNATVKIDLQNELQPDLALLIEESSGGRTRVDEKAYIIGCPELVVEIAVSTRNNDLDEKKSVYEAAGAQEYVVVDVAHRFVHWFSREEERLMILGIDPDGVIRSRAFAGLWLDVDAFFREDSRGVYEALRRGLETPEHAAFMVGIGPDRTNRP